MELRCDGQTSWNLTSGRSEVFHLIDDADAQCFVKVRMFQVVSRVTKVN